jgi:hypothetical protein
VELLHDNGRLSLPTPCLPLPYLPSPVLDALIAHRGHSAITIARLILLDASQCVLTERMRPSPCQAVAAVARWVSFGSSVVSRWHAGRQAAAPRHEKLPKHPSGFRMAASRPPQGCTARRSQGKHGDTGRSAAARGRSCASRCWLDVGWMSDHLKMPASEYPRISTCRCPLRSAYVHASSVHPDSSCHAQWP